MKLLMKIFTISLHHPNQDESGEGNGVIQGQRLPQHLLKKQRHYTKHKGMRRVLLHLLLPHQQVPYRLIS